MGDIAWGPIANAITALCVLIGLVFQHYTRKDMKEVVRQTNHITELAVKQAGETGNIKGRQDVLDEQERRIARE